MSMIEKLRDHRVVVVLRASNEEEAYQKIAALRVAGATCLEITFSIPNADQVIQRVVKNSDLTIGAGTVLTRNQAELAIQAGASFLVSPGYLEEVGLMAKEAGILYIPGVFTPTEVIERYQAGYRLLKLFPASSLSSNHLKALCEVFPDIHFMPTGGITALNMESWFQAGAVAVGMGGALTKGNKDEIQHAYQQVKSELLHL